LGGGRFGEVYSARHWTTDEIVAVKELACDVGDPQAMATLRHPAVLPLHGFSAFVDDGENSPAILMPVMSRGSLGDVVAPDSLSRLGKEWNLTRKQIILLGIASGMMFLHEQRFIHRIFEPKIADFGLAKFVQLNESLCQSMTGGIPLFNGDGIGMDKSQSARYYRLAADQGNLSAQFNCGLQLLNGNGIPMDRSQAVHYFKLAADQGDADALRLYQRSIGRQ
jgi:hypothetical protein